MTFDNHRVCGIVALCALKPFEWQECIKCAAVSELKNYLDKLSKIPRQVLVSLIALTAFLFKIQFVKRYSFLETSMAGLYLSKLKQMPPF